jgi:hypothetical protein
LSRVRPSSLWWVIVLAVAGCATVRNVQLGGDSSAPPAVQNGDRIELTTRDDRHYRLTVVGITETGIEGEDRAGQSVAIAYEDILVLQVREPRPGRTAALAAGATFAGITVLYMIVAAVAVVAIVGGF